MDVHIIGVQSGGFLHVERGLGGHFLGGEMEQQGQSDTMVQEEELVRKRLIEGFSMKEGLPPILGPGSLFANE